LSYLTLNNIVTLKSG